MDSPPKKRICIREGDIFCVEISDIYKRYFQFLTKDGSQLGGNVIRVFKNKYPLQYTPSSMDEIVADEVMFYTITFLRIGIINNAWYKVGNSAKRDMEKLRSIYFVSSHTSRCIPGTLVSVSVNPAVNWYIWRVNEKHEFIGFLPDNYCGIIEPGGVFPYNEVSDRIKRGYYIHKKWNLYSIVKRVPFHDYISYVATDEGEDTRYIEFIGEHAMREAVVTGRKIIRLDKYVPEKEGYRLFDGIFGDRNWDFYEFIDRNEFENIWEQR